MTFKSSGGITLGTSDTTIATCPSATEYGVKLSLANVTSSSKTYTLKHYKASTALTVTMAQDVAIAANLPAPFVWTLTLEPGDIIYASASSAGSICAFAAITNVDTTGGNSSLVPRGAWSSSTTYAVNEIASYSNSSYISLQASNLNKQPDTQTAWWMLLAAQGTTGSTGSTGATGSTGPAPNVTIGTVTTGAAGTSAAATITGTNPNYTLNLTIPTGATGAAGSGAGTVTHTGAPTAGHVAVFSGSSGDIIADGGALAASATTDTTNASNISSGTLASARLPSSGASAGSYGGTSANVPSITVDALGRITSVSDRALTAANVSALALAGGILTGKLNLFASASGGAGLNLGAGAAPTSPASADLWGTTSGLFYYNGTTTIQFAPLASPTFTGTPAAPTATAGTNTTQLASTAFVQAALPVKAAGSDVYGGTEDTKFVTAKALADSQAVLALTDGSTVSWNMANGYNSSVTLGGNRTLSTPTNPKQGQTYTLRVIQDATGSRTLTLPSSSTFDFGAAGAPTLQTGANKYDLITLFCFDASTPKFLAFFNKGA